MPSLKLWLLGSPRLELDGLPLEIGRHKALALLIYLAVMAQEQQRDTLATLLWPESSQSRARASLRRDLSILNKTLAGEWLAIKRETIDLRRDNLWLDMTQFRRRLAECHRHGHASDVVCSACLQPLAAAVELYRADFLTGFSLPDCPDFDEWQFFQAEALRQELSSALERLVQGHSTQGDYEMALPYARRWLALDSLHEPAHRHLMQLYARTGQQAAALRQYQLCVQILEDELGLPPSAETTALYEHIRTTTTIKESAEPMSYQIASLPGAATKLHNFPAQATPFVGRVAGLTDITQRLNDPTYRLLTLIGPGGIGKTRLAIQAAHHLINHTFNHINFADGVYFVSLVAINSPSHLITALAEALNFSFYRQVEPKQQLLNYLREKSILLVLDNFEHLLASALETDLITDLLITAPMLKILVTSREALNLQEEWLYPVEGMRYPNIQNSDNTPTDLAGYSAVQLFVQNARRVRPDFSLPDEQDCVLQICRLVEGMPLALELAATWLKVLPCSQIVDEIERSLDFLTTSLRDVPNRHRSMRAVFEHSWQLLTPIEQDVLCRLTIFRGGFRQAAAEQVAEATLLDLAALVEKSLVRVTPAGRYRLHELLRQFGAEKLTDNPDDQAQTQDRHCDYFVAFLREQELALHNKRQKTALAQIRPEIENIRLAWQHAVNRGDLIAVEQTLDSLYTFYHISSRFQEGTETFRQATEQLSAADETPQILLKLFNRQGALWASLGVYGLARELLQKGLSMARREPADSEIAFSLNLLGNILHIQGESLAAQELYQESLTLSRQIGDQAETAGSLYNLGWVVIRQGHYRAAKVHFQESLMLYRTTENQAGIAHALDSLGMTAFFLGEYEEAHQHYQDSLNIFDALGDQQGQARAIGGLGLVAWGQGDTHLPQAKQLLEASLNINRTIGHRLEVARRLAFLGSVANSMADHAAAQQYLTESLSISQEIGFTFGSPWSLGGLGTAALGQGNLSAAADYFHQAIETAMTSHDIPIVLDTMVALAKLRWQEDGPADSNNANHNDGPLTTKQEQAVEILTVVLDHPTTWQITKDKANLLLDELAVPYRNNSKTLEELVIEILTEQAVFEE